MNGGAGLATRRRNGSFVWLARACGSDGRCCHPHL